MFASLIVLYCILNTVRWTVAWTQQWWCVLAKSFKCFVFRLLNWADWAKQKTAQAKTKPSNVKSNVGKGEVIIVSIFRIVSQFVIQCQMCFWIWETMMALNFARLSMLIACNTRITWLIVDVLSIRFKQYMGITAFSFGSSKPINVNNIWKKK